MPKTKDKRKALGIFLSGHHRISDPGLVKSTNGDLTCKLTKTFPDFQMEYFNEPAHGWPSTGGQRLRKELIFMDIVPNCKYNFLWEKFDGIFPKNNL